CSCVQMDPYPLSLLENSNSVRRSSVLQKLATPPFSYSRQTRSYRKNSVDLTTQMSPLRGGEYCTCHISSIHSQLYTAISFFLIAYLMSSARSCTSIFFMRLYLCTSTVFTLTPNRLAISLTDSPSARSFRTSRSRMLKRS